MNLHVKNIDKKLTKYVKQKEGFSIEFCVEVSGHGYEFGEGFRKQFLC